MMRDEKGRFVKGSTGNPKGRPPRATEKEYLDAVYDEIPIERFRRMVTKQAERAERGDIRALEFIVRVMGLEAARKIDLTGSIGIAELTSDDLAAARRKAAEFESQIEGAASE